MRVFVHKFLIAFVGGGGGGGAGGWRASCHSQWRGRRNPLGIKKEPCGDKGRSEHPWDSQKEVNSNTKATLNSEVTLAGTKLDDKTMVSP